MNPTELCQQYPFFDAMLCETDLDSCCRMELALQVVGLKMTGKIEDARSVAVRIVGNTCDSGSGTGVDSGNIMQLSSATTPSTSFSTRDIRPLLLSRARDSPDFESLIVDFLSILDVDPP